MLVENQTVEVKVTNKTLQYFRSLGYNCNIKDIIKIPAEQLNIGSGYKVDVICDYCGKLYKKPFIDYLNQKGIVNKDCCLSCKSIKTKESMQLQYGVDNIFQLKHIQDKQRNTVLEKYGVDNVSQLDVVKKRKERTTLAHFGVRNPLMSKEVRDKGILTNLEKYGAEYYTQTEEYKERSKATSLEKYGTEYVNQSDIGKKKIREGFVNKYGVDNIFKTPEFKARLKEYNNKTYGVDYYCQTPEFTDKLKQTSLKKWGTEYPMQNPDLRARAKATNLARYGYENVLQSPEIRDKINATLMKDSSVPSSSQQRKIYNIINNLYPNCSEYNALTSRCWLDVALYIDDIKIDIEYDSAHWHKDQQRDRRRDEYLKTQGWKILRIKSGHKIPTKEQLIEAINKLLTTNRTYIEIILDDWRCADE